MPRVTEGRHIEKGARMRERILATALRLLQARAAAIEDERRRRSFLENVPAHRAIVELAAGL